MVYPNFDLWVCPTETGIFQQPTWLHAQTDELGPLYVLGIIRISPQRELIIQK